MKVILHIIKTWKLPVAMVIGFLLFFVIDAMPLTSGQQDVLYYAITHYIQPGLIFTMLFISFLKVKSRDLMPHRWHGMLLFTQGALFVLCSMLALTLPSLWSDVTAQSNVKVICEGAMLCFICPTATASVVIVHKLHGSMSGIVTYIILCNLMVSLLAPSFLTLVEPHAGMDFLTELFMIMGKVFPLLLCPFFLAMIVRNYTPHLKQMVLRIPDLAFYLWLVALPLAITVTVRTIALSHISLLILSGLAIVSLVSCVVQFMLGWRIGGSGESAITAGQAFGQKNTVFVIWMGLVFLNPVSSVVGGFYSVWHNIINSWQLYKEGK